MMFILSVTEKTKAAMQMKYFYVCSLDQKQKFVVLN